MSHRQLQTLSKTLAAIGAKIPSKIEAERAGIDVLAERVSALDVGNRLAESLIDRSRQTVTRSPTPR